MRKRSKLTIAAIYDTETTNIGEAENTRAFPILFIVNDIRDIDLYEYTPDRDDKISFYRTEHEMLDVIESYVFWGECLDRVPVICAYNLMFDLQPLMEELDAAYEIKANAQSSTNVYTVDLYKDGKHALRFWDTYHLEMRGLAAMGKTAGLSKASGDWDYSLVRTPETPLTDLELFYAGRDTQVIPAYLKYLLHANEWMRQSDFGNVVITKTSIVRQMARREIERLTVPKKDGSKLELRNSFMRLCKKELPKNYYIYGLRKGCFRGGWTFTAARYALTLQSNVVSADAVSMHHTFINGRYIPENFRVINPRMIEEKINTVLNTSVEYVLENYEKPFNVAFHAKLRIKNIRLKEATCFKECGIALLATSKFKSIVPTGGAIGLDPTNAAQENAVRSAGFHDQFERATFAFGKLYKADTIVVHVNELELWTMSRVYEWDSLQCIVGEVSTNFILPPDFVTLQSNKLFEQKSAAKFIAAHYHKGEPYPFNIKYIPDGIAENLRNGTLEPRFFEQWYSNTVKGMFNSIYGTMAQDVFRPAYKCEDGELIVDKDTVTTEENYESRKPRSTRVLYTYGMRIVGGSRMHMALLMECLWNALGNKVRVLGGDTDSVKVSCNEDVSDADLEAAMKPIGDAATKAIYKCMARLRKNFPELASTLKGIGTFEIENRGKHYDLHVELWNKARVSFDGKRTHITCAGLPRPIGAYTIETFMDELIAAGNDPGTVLQEVIGFDTFVQNTISHTLEHHKPRCTDLFDETVTDYLGMSTHVCAHQSVALYAAPRWVGDTDKINNRLSVEYLEHEYGRNVDTTTKYLERDRNNGRGILLYDTELGIRPKMQGLSCAFRTLVWNMEKKAEYEKTHML